MLPPLTHVLSKIFVHGFYRAHAGMFLFFFLVMIGAIDPGQLLNYHKTLMLAFINSPLMLVAVFGIWLLYAIKAWLYITGQIAAPHQHFLFYSSNSFHKVQQFKSWFLVQFLILLPLACYGVTAVLVGVFYGYYLGPISLLLYLTLLCAIGAWLCTRAINQLVGSGRQSRLFGLTTKLSKPFFSLYSYHILNRLKVPFVITKVLTWLIVNDVFYLFDDVKHDERVAGMAILAIAVAHSFIVFEERRFDESYLAFFKNLPYTSIKRFGMVLIAYLPIILPEGVWLFSRFSPALALQLVLMLSSVVALLHSLLYYLGLNMDKYLPWVMGVFVLLFWVMMFRLMPFIIAGNLMFSYFIFRRYYYRDLPTAAKAESGN